MRRSGIFIGADDIASAARQGVTCCRGSSEKSGRGLVERALYGGFGVEDTHARHCGSAHWH